jgi:hypothetical protein
MKIKDDRGEPFNAFFDQLVKFETVPTIIGTDPRNVTHIYVAQLNAACATWFLNEHMPNMRPVHAMWVIPITNDIVKGYFGYDMKAMGFDISGRLVEGGHRARALIDAAQIRPGVTIEEILHFGVPEEAWKHANDARGGRAADMWRTMDKKYAAILARTCSLIISYLAYGDFTRKGQALASSMAQEELVKNYPYIPASVIHYGRWLVREIPLSLLATVDFIMRSWVGEEKTADVMEQITQGSAIKGTPIAAYNYWREASMYKIKNRDFSDIEVAYTMLAMAKKQFKGETVSKCRIVREMPTWDDSE